MILVGPIYTNDEDFEKKLKALFEFGRENKEYNDTTYALEDGACPT